MTVQGEQAKVLAAKWYYRWSLSQGILGAVFSALTFSGVFTLLLGPIFQQWGLGYSSALFLLLGVVMALFLGLGFVLDRIVRFWTAQSYIGTTRNPFLIDRLYEKEWLKLRYQDVPLMKAIREVVAEGIMTPTRRHLVEELDACIVRLEQTVRDKKWTINENENVYGNL